MSQLESNTLAKAPRASSAPFSYAAAEQSARQRAANALSAHGARGNPSPAAAAPAGAKSQVSAGGAFMPERSVRDGSPSVPTATAPTAVAGRSAPTNAPAPAPALGAAAGGSSSMVATGAGAAHSAGQPAGQSSAIGARDAHKPTRAAPLKAPAAPPPPRTEEFARLIAQRLEGATQFDIAFGDGAQGAIEGRMVLGDDGEAVLRLTFDRLETYQHFAADEAALRAHLAGSGFRFGEGSIRLAHRDAEAFDAAPSSEPAPTPSLAWTPGGRTIDITI